MSLAASVVEAYRLEVWRAMKRVCRSIMRYGAAVDIDERLPDIKRRDVLIKKGRSSAHSATMKLQFESERQRKRNVKKLSGRQSPI